MLDPTIGYLIDFCGAALLAGAAGHKWRRLGDFSESFAAYRLMPAAWAHGLARVIPILESAICVALILPWAHRGGALAAATLLSIYAVAIALNLARGRRELDCGCAGPGRRRPIGAWMVWRNLLFAALLAMAASPWSSRPLTAADLLTITAGLTVIALLDVSIEQLAAEIAPRGLAIRGRA
ncbi:MAG: methylamine utilization protein MauE [Steroidobacteraceae bacterium]|nr:methylamine utilization protein MauE [Steroidobacteraceae bacterium]